MYRKSEEQALEALTIARMEESGIVGTQGCNPICPIEGCSDNAETSNLSMVLQNLQLSKDDEELFMGECLFMSVWMFV